MKKYGEPQTVTNAITNEFKRVVENNTLFMMIMKTENNFQKQEKKLPLYLGISLDRNWKQCKANM